MPNTDTLGSPLPNGAQLRPPSSETNTPMSVPTKISDDCVGSIAKALTGTSGSAVAPEPLIAVNTGVVFRLVIFQTCDCAAVMPAM